MILSAIDLILNPPTRVVVEVSGFLWFRVGLGLGLLGGRVEEDDGHGGSPSPAGGGGGRRLGLGIWVIWVWGIPIADSLRCWSGAAVARRWLRVVGGEAGR
jgi:hypothetical protein